MRVYNDIRELIGNTPMLRLHPFETKPDVKLYAKLELWNPAGSVKDRIGVYMLEDAERRGELKPGATIIEATAGNTGLGFALGHKIRLQDHLFAAKRVLLDGIIGKQRV